MERCNKTKAERRELIFKMNYILLMFLTEKNLLEKFIDNCKPVIAYSDFSTINILIAFSWSDFEESDIWCEANYEYRKYRDQAMMRMNDILNRR